MLYESADIGDMKNKVISDGLGREATLLNDADFFFHLTSDGKLQGAVGCALDLHSLIKIDSSPSSSPLGSTLRLTMTLPRGERPLRIVGIASAQERRCWSVECNIHALTSSEASFHFLHVNSKYVRFPLDHLDTLYDSDIFVAADSSSIATNWNVVLDPSARLHFALGNLTTHKGLLSHTVKANLHEGAQLVAAWMGLGGDKQTTDINIECAGKNSQCELRTGILGSGGQQNHLRAHITHTAPASNSAVLSHGAVSGSATHQLDLRAHLTHEARNARAEQTNKNWILSPSSRIITQPQLEIDTGQVECRHGATVSTVPQVPLYYLQSRGIAHEQATALLVQGLLKPVAECFSGASPFLQDNYVQSTLEAQCARLASESPQLKEA